MPYKVTQQPSLGNVPTLELGAGLAGVRWEWWGGVKEVEESVGGVAGHRTGRATALGLISLCPGKSACSGFFIQCFPSFLLCNKTTTKGLDATMCLNQKLPFEIPVSTFPTLTKSMKQQSIGTLKQR